MISVNIWYIKRNMSEKKKTSSDGSKISLKDPFDLLIIFIEITFWNNSIIKKKFKPKTNYKWDFKTT